MTPSQAASLLLVLAILAIGVYLVWDMWRDTKEHK